MSFILKGSSFIQHAPGGAKSKSYRRTPKERKMALKHRTPPALNEHRYLNQFCASRIQFWVPGRPLGFDFRTWGYNLGPPGIDFVSILGLYSSRIGPLRVNFVLSGLNFGPLRVDFWRWGLDFGPLEVIFCPFWLLEFNFRRLGFDFRTWGCQVYRFKDLGL